MRTLWRYMHGGEWRPVTSMWRGTDRVYHPAAANVVVIWFPPEGFVPLRAAPGDIFPDPEPDASPDRGWDFS